jgi:hypothetical protein
MINFKTEEEKSFVMFYVKKIGDDLTRTLFEKMSVSNSEEAIHLSNFFWDMVDAAIQDEKNNIKGEWDTSAEFITEKVMYAISGYLEKNGYETEWDQVSDFRN